jgi:hypothetical protein
MLGWSGSVAEGSPMTDDDSDTARRQGITPEPQFASIPAFQGVLILHALAAAFVGVQGWKVTLGYGIIGADSVSDFYAMHFFFLAIFGVTPALNLLAAIHLTSRPARARRYLDPALVLAWIQVACGMLFALTAAGTGFFVLPLLFVVPYAFVVGLATKAAMELETGSHRGRTGGWRLAAADLAVFTVVSAVLAIPVALFDNRYHVF